MSKEMVASPKELDRGSGTEGVLKTLHVLWILTFT